MGPIDFPFKTLLSPLTSQRDTEHKLHNKMFINQISNRTTFYYYKLASTVSPKHFIQSFLKIYCIYTSCNGLQIILFWIVLLIIMKWMIRNDIGLTLTFITMGILWYFFSEQIGAVGHAYVHGAWAMCQILKKI